MNIGRITSLKLIQKSPKRLWVGKINCWDLDKKGLDELLPELIWNQSTKKWTLQTGINKWYVVDMRAQVIGQKVYIYITQK